LKYLITIFIFLFPLSLYAGDKIDRAFITYKGTQGYFFSEKIGDQILKDLETYKLQIKELDIYKLKIIKLQDKIELLQLNVEVTEKITQGWQIVAKEQVVLAQNAEAKYARLRDKKEKWYRTPVFWMGFGMIVGGAMAVGITFGIKEAKESFQ